MTQRRMGKRSRKTTRRPKGPTTAPQSAMRKSKPFTYEPTSEQAGQWVNFTMQPRDEHDQLVALGSTGYKVIFYMGSSVPEHRVGDQSLGRVQRHLRIPNGMHYSVQLPQDGEAPPIFDLFTDSQGYLDRIEVIIRDHHIDPSTVQQLLAGVQDVGSQIAAEEEAYRRIMPTMSMYSFLGRVPIRLHSMESMDLATGTRRFERYAPYPSVTLNLAAGLNRIPMHDEFNKAFALYREALCSDNPYYTFLTLYKIGELIYGVEGYEGLRSRLCKEQTAASLRPTRPDEMYSDPPYANDPYKDRRYREVFDQDFQHKYRNAIAHIQLKSGDLRRLDDMADLRDMRDAAWYIHKMVRDLLLHEWEAFQQIIQAQVGTPLVPCAYDQAVAQVSSGTT